MLRLHFATQSFDGLFQVAVFCFLPSKERTSQAQLFMNALRRKKISVAKLVATAAKVFDLDQSPIEQGVNDVMRLA